MPQTKRPRSNSSSPGSDLSSRKIRRSNSSSPGSDLSSRKIRRSNSTQDFKLLNESSPSSRSDSSFQFDNLLYERDSSFQFDNLLNESSPISKPLSLSRSPSVSRSPSLSSSRSSSVSSSRSPSLSSSRSPSSRSSSVSSSRSSSSRSSSVSSSRSSSSRSSKASNSSNTSQREKYVKRYLNKPVVLNAKYIFQVSMHPDQFINYRQITKDTRIECFIQTLFSLGLREKHEAIRDVKKLQSKEEGTEWREAASYLQHSFGLNNGQITHVWDSQQFSNNNAFAERTHQILDDELDNNYATILTIQFFKPEDASVWGHFMIAYKYQDQIVYFDPQKNHITLNIIPMVTGKHYVKKVGFFRVQGVDTPIPLKSTTCSIKFIGGTF